MTKETRPTSSLMELSSNLWNAYYKYRAGMDKLLTNCEDETPPIFSEEELSQIMQQMSTLFRDPQFLVSESTNLWNDYLKLMNESNSNEAPKDKRFKDRAWQEHPVFNFMKNSYELHSKWLHGLTQEIKGLDKKTKHKLDFYTQLFIDSVAPSNFPFLNPKVIEKTLETNGASISRGAENFLNDIQKTGLQISTADKEEFKLGENLAVTKGKVVFENELIQLIQYTPSTKEVHEKPILITPAWINKFYILDLQQKNSLVKWIVDQGYTVFMVSWVNPDSEFADYGFEDYLNKGLITAIEQVLKIAGTKQLNCVGYCLGGTLLAVTAAYLRSKKRDVISSLSFLTTLVDFEEVGDVGVLIDDNQLEYLESRMSKKGYLDGYDMASTFSMLRANDMIWSFIVNNYYLGHEPLKFDILCWNSDPTRLPAKMHSYYLRNMYQHNCLRNPGALEMLNTPIDLTQITVPTYMLSTEKDHIAPWRSTFKATKIYSGPKKFVLSGSGHVAGVVNPPEQNKYYYLENDDNSGEANIWMQNAKRTEGSWWPNWEKWIKQYAGKKVPARRIQDKQAIEDAPGRYVKMT